MNARLLFIFCTLFLAGRAEAQNVSPVQLGNLTCEHLVNPIGIGDQQPRLSWKLMSDRTGEAQTAYEIRAASTAAGLTGGQPDLWNSGKVASDASVLIPWGGKALGSRSQVFWQVRVWDKDGQPSAWSNPASFELGLLSPPTEWKGRWITADLPRFDMEENSLSKSSWINAGSAANQPAAARFELDLPANAKILGARIDANADGLLALYVNGKPTKQGSSSHTAPFHADFSAQLQPGKNIIALGAIPVRNSNGGGRNAIAARGLVELADGTRIDFVTDGSWQTAIPAITRAGGANKLSDAWFAIGAPETDWVKATVVGAYDAAPAVATADSTIGPGRYLRKTFTVKGPIAKARLYSTALGAYEASLNGKPVNDHQFDPGWTDYAKRVMVQTTDVTTMLTPGKNAIGALLGDGWFAGRVGWMGLYQYKQIGTRPLFNAQLEISYADGSTDIITTDNSWKGGAGELVGSDEQMGEVIDARKAVTAWNQPSFDDSAWAGVALEDHALPLVPQLGPPVRKLMELTPKKITHQGNLWLVDFGQNMVGHVRLSARGPAGSTITVSHGEMLNADGSLYTENLRPAISLDTFTLKGSPDTETFEPRFTFHGFRYAAISGYPGELTADNIRGVVVGSDTPTTGTWESSDKDLNQLYSNILWGQRGNFLSVPTDCPQRDERMGWMGDAQVFAPTAARNADVSAFFTKWMVDVDDAQGAAGDFSTVSPRANQNQSYPVWGDAGVIIPWAMYNSYGDKKFLADNYAYMTRWINYTYDRSGFLPTGGVGDHLAPTTGRPGATNTSMVDAAYFANSARIVSKAAAILGRPEDAAAFDKFYRDAVAAFNDAYIAADGTVEGDTQTGYILALQFDLLPENLRAAAAQKLAAAIQKTGHLTTGFVGSGLICPALTQIGRSDLAWQLIFTDTYPSWLFPVKNGATTIWERWDGWTPDKGFQDSSMNSFNHYSFGAVGYWFYTGAAGILPDPASPGYKHFLLEPQFTSKLSHVKATLDSPYGLISSHWHTEGNQMLYDVTIPPNSSATLTIPFAQKDILQSGQPVAANGSSASTTTLNLPAGAYHLSFPKQLIK